MQPTETGQGFHFKEAGFALVTAEHVVQVHTVQQHQVAGIEGRIAFKGVDAPHVFQRQTINGGQLLVEVDAHCGARILEEGTVGQRGHDTAIYSYGPIIAELHVLFLVGRLGAQAAYAHHAC